MLSPHERLIVALDVATSEEAGRMVHLLGDTVVFYKIGMELGYAPGGLELAKALITSGKKIFLDFKLHDISATVEKATRQIACFGANFLTVHGYPQTMAAARKGAEGTDLGILAVTVMTSYNDADLETAGYDFTVDALIHRRARQALQEKMAGLILSPQELASIRPIVGSDMLLVTPGVRPIGSAVNDQKRAATPGAAIAAGADYLVVGRPILESRDPKAVAESIIAEIAAAAKFSTFTWDGPDNERRS